MATPSKAKRAAKRRAEYLRREAQKAARKGGWAVEGDSKKGLTLHFGAA